MHVEKSDGNFGALIGALGGTLIGALTGVLGLLNPVYAEILPTIPRILHFS